ncbi:glycosyltransferase family 1 protein [Paraflavitalea soli]|uniref:Glycosyltransferase family 1 protein n=1 Tax=Paraflavitalea soli TaxID=2315862 RepID=A0A3B7MQ50_9BACT|nr:glycosyltransferase [Paraflavitalea soli]AXY75170.1 glycosyltransferase family 1 protein [Paraflavitalea soli]
MTIAFVHRNKAFLPEIEAYTRFFTNLGVECIAITKEETDRLRPEVEWRMMGFDGSKPRAGVAKIHEYASASLPPGRYFKNLRKSLFNAQPDFRLFLNEYVRKTFNFRDKVPFGYRDMGIPPEWLFSPTRPVMKAYDFVYAGSLDKSRNPERLLDHFSMGSMKGRSLLLISHHYEGLQTQYAAHENIVFKGPFEHREIRHYLNKARFGINYIADKEPFNQQTSTKFLEYLACGLPVVSTDYQWVRDFQHQYGGDYFFLSPDLSSMDWESICGFNYSSPDMRLWTWERKIRASGVLEFLKMEKTIGAL